MRLLDRLPDKVLRALDTKRPWNIAFIVAVTGILIWTSFLTQRSIREEAARQARIESDYRGCIRSIPSLRSISRHVSGVNDLARVLVENSEVLLKHTSVAQREFRLENLARLKAAEVKIAAVKSFDVPTMKTCEERRKALGG